MSSIATHLSQLINVYRQELKCNPCKTFAITYLTWTRTVPIMTHLTNVYKDAANYLIIQENTTVSKWLCYVCPIKYRENLHYTYANGHIYMIYGRKIYCLCISAQLLEPRLTAAKRGLQLMVKPRFTNFSIEPRFASARDGRKPRLKCGPTAWGVRDKLGSSAAQMSGAAVSRIGGSRIYTGPVL